MMDLGNLFPGQLRPVRGGAGQGAVAEEEEPVLDRFQLFLARRRAQDPEITVHLRAVSVDDCAADLLSERKGDCRLAACGRSGDEDERRTRLKHGDRNADSAGTAR